MIPLRHRNITYAVVLQTGRNIYIWPYDNHNGNADDRFMPLSRNAAILLQRMSHLIRDMRLAHYALLPRLLPRESSEPSFYYNAFCAARHSHTSDHAITTHHYHIFVGFACHGGVLGCVASRPLRAPYLPHPSAIFASRSLSSPSFRHWILGLAARRSRQNR